MRRTKVAALATASLFCAAAMVPLAAPSVAGPAAPDVESAVDGSLAHPDLRTMPWQKRYEAIRQAGLEQRLRSGGKGDVQKVGKGTFAKVAQTGTDKIFVVLAEFGDTRHSAFPDGETDATTYLGPLHNQIPKPNRSTDTSTIWQKDYSQAHFADMYDKRMKNFYETQSHGKYSVDGDVTEWVKVPFNQARYGRDVCGDVVCNNTWFLVRDALAEWTQLKLDDGWTMQRIQDYLKTFDLQDRYDFDEDGDFDEPDGYIDHFQIVHAG
ncbi:MAG: peptidase M6, partial [Actinobacteria bacterium]|nr:peptidase M6 [Actinomycetota bacterium]